MRSLGSARPCADSVRPLSCIHCTFMNALPVSHPHYPTKNANALASLVKGRWLDGKAQALTLLHLLAIRPPFLYCKLFCRQDGGIVTPPSPRPSTKKAGLCLFEITKCSGAGYVESCLLCWFRILAKLWASTITHPCTTRTVRVLPPTNTQKV